MQRIFALVRFDDDPQQPLSRTEHRRWKVLGWGYLLVWLLVGVIVYYVFRLPTFFKLFLSLILIIGTPALADLRESYDQYLTRAAKAPNADTNKNTGETK